VGFSAGEILKKRRASARRFESFGLKQLFIWKPTV
jgi:hypothetical protein